MTSDGYISAPVTPDLTFLSSLPVSSFLDSESGVLHLFWIFYGSHIPLEIRLPKCSRTRILQLQEADKRSEWAKFGAQRDAQTREPRRFNRVVFQVGVPPQKFSVSC